MWLLASYPWLLSPVFVCYLQYSHKGCHQASYGIVHLLYTFNRVGECTAKFHVCLIKSLSPQYKAIPENTTGLLPLLVLHTHTADCNDLANLKREVLYTY